eukprot:6185814-Pleurochrysis_carterae.AAC.11
MQADERRGGFERDANRRRAMSTERVPWQHRWHRRREGGRLVLRARGTDRSEARLACSVLTRRRSSYFLRPTKATAALTAEGPAKHAQLTRRSAYTEEVQAETEKRTSETEKSTSETEKRTTETEKRTPGIEKRTSETEKRTSETGKRTSSLFLTQGLGHDDFRGKLQWNLTILDHADEDG